MLYALDNYIHILPQPKFIFVKLRVIYILYSLVYPSSSVQYVSI